MDLERLRRFCLSLPHTTEKIQWEDALLFCVGGKIFVSASLDPGSACRLAFKTSPERFAELLEREGAMPAPYVGRFHWIGLKDTNALRWGELQSLIHESYELIAAKLPKQAGRRKNRPRRRAR